MPDALPRDALAFLGTLASGLVHEIKNPLSTIAINLALLEEDLLAALPHFILARGLEVRTFLAQNLYCRCHGIFRGNTRLRRGVERLIKTRIDLNIETRNDVVPIIADVAGVRGKRFRFAAAIGMLIDFDLQRFRHFDRRNDVIEAAFAQIGVAHEAAAELPAVAAVGNHPAAKIAVFVQPDAAVGQFALQVLLAAAGLRQSRARILQILNLAVDARAFAEARGATIHERTRIVRIEPLPNHIVIETEDGALERYDRVLLTAGAWLPKLLPELNLPLTVTRQTYAYFALHADAESHYEPERLPVWIEATRHFYGFPKDGRQTGVKIAWHRLGEVHDPDLPAHPVNEADLAPLQACIARRLNGVSGTALSTATCLYTNAPEEEFLLQPLPDDSRVWFVSACSGHGFKFSILNGYEAAQKIMAGAP